MVLREESLDDSFDESVLLLSGKTVAGSGLVSSLSPRNSRHWGIRDNSNAAVDAAELEPPSRAAPERAGSNVLPLIL